MLCSKTPRKGSRIFRGVLQCMGFPLYEYDCHYTECANDTATSIGVTEMRSRQSARGWRACRARGLS